MNAPEKLHVKLLKEGDCAVHDWPSEGMMVRLVREMRRTHGKGGVTVCRECLDRAMKDQKGKS